MQPEHLEEKSTNKYLNDSTFDDVVFAYRHKEYGAFELRRRYTKHLLWALCAGAALATLFLGVTFWRLQSKEDLIDLDEVMIEVDIFDASKISTLETPPESPPPPPPSLDIPAEPTMVQDQTQSPSETAVDPASNPDDAKKQADSVKNNPVPVQDNNNNSNTNTNPNNTNISADENRVGGIEEFKKWVNQNVQYPAEALAAKKEGRIFVEFWVNEDGSISDVKILKGFAFGMDQAAVDVVMKAPKWRPQPTRKRLTVPVEFRLSNVNK
ncbi:MAG: energy transducer TonB [Cytophagales bacterium]|nr:MAG: energy transducer TonB [Cytophagales bacterium]TAF62144.1 MAG: energy transducer TonB [Cytophagales bacterium]